MNNKIQLYVVYKQYTENLPKDVAQSLENKCPWKIKGQEKLTMPILIKIELG